MLFLCVYIIDLALVIQDLIVEAVDMGGEVGVVLINGLVEVYRLVEILTADVDLYFLKEVLVLTYQAIEFTHRHLALALVV